MREQVLIQMDGELFHRLILIWLFYDVSFYIYLKGTVTRVLLLLDLKITSILWGLKTMM
jgi:hypothetical protein